MRDCFKLREMSQSVGLQRVRGKKFVKKIVIGSESYPVVDRAEDDPNSHIWKVYFKPYYSGDMEGIVSKVQFTLHESYAVPMREVTEPPFEVIESGWGEFEIGITIYFADNAEKPVTLYHVIRLFPIGQTEQPTKEKPLVSEHYDELVFIDPPECLFNKLAEENCVDSQKLTFQHHSNWDLIIENTKQLITGAQNRILDEIAATKRRIEVIRQDNENLKNSATQNAEKSILDKHSNLNCSQDSTTNDTSSQGSCLISSGINTDATKSSQIEPAVEKIPKISSPPLDKEELLVKNNASNESTKCVTVELDMKTEIDRGNKSPVVLADNVILAVNQSQSSSTECDNKLIVNENNAETNASEIVLDIPIESNKDKVESKQENNEIGILDTNS